MREILFRGKTYDGEWVYGGYHYEHGFAKVNEKRYITVYETFGAFGYNAFVEVEQGTVGQFTGALDNNGKKIFEGDIVSFYEVLGQKIDMKPFKGVVKYGKCYYYVEYINARNRKGKWDLSSCWHLVVVGNVHDNKELLK